MKNTTSDEDGKRSIVLAILITILAVIAFLIPSPPTDEPVPQEPKPHVSLIHTAYAHEIEPRIVLIATTSNQTVDTDEMVVEKAVDIPELLPELAVICSCESAGHSHKNADGELLSGYVDNDDKGECQINTRYHGDTMEAMGLDIKDDADYRTYANFLFETQGRQPWMASAACWAPIIGY